MITIESTSMALNDKRAAVIYNMEITKTVQPSDSMDKIVDMILKAASNANGGKIKNLILTAHGIPGCFIIGTGLSKSTMAPFAKVKGIVFKIWFRGCWVARIAGQHTAAHGDGAALRGFGINKGNGHDFISNFAKLTGCYVVAPTEAQASKRKHYPQGLMDTYEGLVLSYGPDGKISWQHRYPSVYDFDISAKKVSKPNRE